MREAAAIDPPPIDRKTTQSNSASNNDSSYFYDTFFFYSAACPFANITVTFEDFFFLLSGRFHSFLIPYSLHYILLVELCSAIILRLRDITESDVLIFDICKGYKTQTDSLKKIEKSKTKRKRSAKILCRRVLLLLVFFAAWCRMKKKGIQPSVVTTSPECGGNKQYQGRACTSVQLQHLFKRWSGVFTYSSQCHSGGGGRGPDCCGGNVVRALACTLKNPVTQKRTP